MSVRHPELLEGIFIISLPAENKSSILEGGYEESR